MYRYKAQYSLDCENPIANAVLLKPQTPEMGQYASLLAECQTRLAALADEVVEVVFGIPVKVKAQSYAGCKSV